MAEQNQTPLIILLFIALSVSILYIAYLWTNPLVEVKEIIKEDNKPPVLYIFDSWGENINDSSEFLVSGWIYNFGYEEAKNIVITCPITIDDKIINTMEYKAGNIASTSYKYVEFSKVLTVQDNAFTVCKIKSCDNCINLIDRIPEEE